MPLTVRGPLLLHSDYAEKQRRRSLKRRRQQQLGNEMPSPYEISDDEKENFSLIQAYEDFQKSKTVGNRRFKVNANVERPNLMPSLFDEE
jgi:hypothetical protein